MRRPARRVLGGLGALLILVACQREPQWQVETLSIFGGEAEIKLHGADAAQTRAALDEIVERFSQMHRDWHAWEPGALTRLNAALARGESASAPPSIVDLIRRSQALSISSDGLFDPAVGGLLRLWGFHTSTFPITAPLPTREQLDAWRQARPSIADVVLVGDQVSSLNPEVQLDFGGIAEGVAAEVAVEILREHQVHNALLTLGGDYYALGDAGGRPWSVGLRDPYGGVLADIELRDGEALFTSGNYNKFRNAPSGARWAHVLDPRSGQPVLGSAAVAVLHRDPVLADIATTALMIGGVARFAALSEQLKVRCALLVTEENELIVTAAMDARIRLRREPVRLGEPLGEPGECTP